MIFLYIYHNTPNKKIPIKLNNVLVLLGAELHCRPVEELVTILIVVTSHWFGKHSDVLIVPFK